MKPHPKKKEKTIGKLKQDLQKVFNAYIRKRDEGKPCISCNIVKPLQAGHFYPVSGWDGLRFNEDNVHGECEYCNCWNEGHLIGYGRNLETRIGKGNLDGLHFKAHVYKQNGHKWSRAELQEKINYYSMLL